ncbi:MAG: 3-deoxy-D-arabino-heptulosonate 7-phosphate synthase [Candidatus Aureabacteria bacterium]|nr:3-deoxy-D-arabino-heptulosonate 7-phosphate synthase [Candidatus Auribacterota bacterium]
MIIEVEKEYQNTLVEINEIIRSKGCRPEVLHGDLYNVIAVEGDASQLDCDFFESFPGVVRAWRISSSYKTIARKVIGPEHQKVERERIKIIVPGMDGKERIIGDDHYTFIAGPCTVESYDQLARIADSLAALADRYNIRHRMMLRGGAFKPRTRPWDFRGLGFVAIDYLDKVRENTGLPYVTEVMAVEQVADLSARADMLQIGTRNYQNFNLLEAVGQTSKPVLYKRGVAAPLEEWLSAAEYIAIHGNKNILLCERGVKSTTHGDYNRSHIDFDVIRAIKERTILPAVIDPSHSAGFAELVPYQFCAATAYGANATIVEVISDDIDRRVIKCDARQGIRLKVYEKLIQYQLKQEELVIPFEDRTKEK